MTKELRGKHTPSALAQAIAVRAKTEAQWMRDVITQDPERTSVNSPFSVEEIVAEAQIVDDLLNTQRKVFIRDEVIDAYSVPDSEELYKRLPLKTRVIGAVSPTTKKNIKMQLEDSRQLTKIRQKLSPEVPGEMSALLNSIEEAKALGEKHGVPPELVYTDDTLYQTLVRRTFSPDDLSNRVLDLHRTPPEETEEIVFDYLYEAIKNTGGVTPTDDLHDISEKTKIYTDGMFTKIKDDSTKIVLSTLERIWP